MPSHEPTARQEGSQSISRAIQLLSIVAEGGEGGVRLSWIAERSELHVATTRRILQALVAEGLLAFNAFTKLYTIGPAIFSFAVKGNPWFARREVFMPVLDRVAEKTRDTVLFSIRSGSESVCLARREGHFPIRVMTLETGSRRPLGAGSGSLAILAFLEKDERDAILKANAEAFKPYKLTVRDVAQMIDDARQKGFSFNPAKIIEDVYGVGVPIFVNGEVVASISVTAISSRMQPDRRAEIVETIRSELLQVAGVQLAPRASAPMFNHGTRKI